MATKTKRCDIKVDPETLRYWQTISKSTGYSQRGLLHDIGRELFSLVASYPEDTNFNYLTSQSGSTVTLQILGRNRVLVSGRFETNMSEPIEDAITKITCEKGDTFHSLVQKMVHESQFKNQKKIEEQKEKAD